MCIRDSLIRGGQEMVQTVSASRPSSVSANAEPLRNCLLYTSTEEAGEMLFYFSKLLRQTLSRSDEFIPLSRWV